MSPYPACVAVLAAMLSTAVDARSAVSPALIRSDITGAAAIAGSYGAVTSIFRTAAHNRAVGGVPNSYHLQGRAIDVARRPGVTHHQIASALQRAGYRMIESLDEGDHSHFAIAPNSAPELEVTAPKAEAPPPPKYPPILADEHGTLQLDLTPAAKLKDR